MKCPECGSPDVHRSRVRNVKEDMVTTFTSLRYFRCSNCNGRFRQRKPRGAPTPGMTRKPRLRRMIFYLRILFIVIVIIVALVLLIMPYMSIPKPVGRPR